MADSFFGAGQKRVFGGAQGDKDDPDPMRGAPDVSDTMTRATAQQLKTRKIAAPRSRRGGASGFSSRESSIDRQLGNPFAQLPTAQTSNAQSSSANSGLFAGFGQPQQQQQQQQSTPAFGASVSQSFPSGNDAFGKPSSSFSFGASSQPQSSSFPPPSSSTAAGQSAPSFSFGAPSGNSAFTFGSAPLQNTAQQPSGFSFSSGPGTAAAVNNPFASISKDQPAKPAGTATTTSLFGSTSQTSQPLMFGQSSGAGSQATNGGLFGSKPTTSSSPFGMSTPASSNLFRFGGNGTGTASRPAQQPEPAASAANIDDIMTSPPVTPEKPAAAAASTTPKTSLFSGANLFANASAAGSAAGSTAATSTTPAPAAPAAPSTSLFSSTPAPSTIAFGSTSTPSTAPAAAGAGTASQDPPPAASLFGQAASQGPHHAAKQPTSSLFSAFSPQTATPSNNVFAPPLPKSKEPTAGDILSELENTLRSFNQAFKVRISTLSEEDDWSPMLLAYLRQMRDIKDSLLAKAGTKRRLELANDSDRSKRARALDKPQHVATPEATPAAPAPLATAAPAAPAQPDAPVFPQTNNTSTTPTSSPSKSQTANLFASIVGNNQPSSPSPAPASLFGNTFSTPAPAGQSAAPSSLFGTSTAAPSTPSQPAANLFANQMGAQTAQKPSTTNIFGAANGNFSAPPKTSNATNLFASTANNASTPKPTSNLFAAAPAADKPATTSTSLFGGSSSNGAVSTPKASAQSSNPFANIAKGPSPTSFLKNPAAAASTPATTSAQGAAAPKFEMPKFTPAVGGDMFAAFSAQAAKQQEKSEDEAEQKELEKRFDDDYDSDKEDEASFNKRVLKEIRAERAKAKQDKANSSTSQVKFEPGKGFSFGSTSTATEKNGESQETPPSSAGSAPAAAPQAKSIFDSGYKPAITGSSLFGHLSQTQNRDDDDGDDSDNEQASSAPSQADSTGGNNGASKSLFDRVSKADKAADDTSDSDSGSADKSHGVNGHAAAASPFSGGGSIFGRASTGGGSVFGQKTPTTDDHTWKNDSPIRFGGAPDAVTTPTKTNGATTSTPAPPQFTNIFGEARPNATPSLFSTAPATTTTTTVKPTFNFGVTAPTNGSAASVASASPPATRESSVQHSTEEAGEANNLDGATPDAQVSLSDLTEHERRDNDVMLDISAARVLEYEAKTKSWERRGTGPLRVLKSKESGRIQVLGRSNPQGKILINSPLVKGLKYESVAKGRVKFPVVTADGRISTLLITVKGDDTAQQLAQLCEANKPT